MSEKRYEALTYKCRSCGASGVKLWRLYNAFLSAQELTCLACSKRETGEELVGDTIGWRIPACPDMLPNEEWGLPDGATYWGYTSVPDDLVKWWKELPPDLSKERRPR